MITYNEYSSFVTHNEHEKVHHSLNGLSFQQRREFFSLARSENNYLVMDALLADEASKKTTDLSPFLAIAVPMSASLAILFVIHGADLFCEIGDSTLYHIIKNQDDDFADELERLRGLEKEIRQFINVELAKTQQEDARFRILNRFLHFVDTLKILHMDLIEEARRGFLDLEALLIPLLKLTKRSKFARQERRLLLHEIDLAYSLFFEYPFYQGHYDNLVERFKKDYSTFKMLKR